MKYNIYDQSGEHIGTCCVQGMEQAQDFAQGLTFVPAEEDTQAQQSELVGDSEAFQPIIAPEHEESAKNLILALAIGGGLCIVALIGHILGLN